MLLNSTGQLHMVHIKLRYTRLSAPATTVAWTAHTVTATKSQDIMIVLEDEPNSPVSERTPLKSSGLSQSTSSAAAHIPPPPPYAATAAPPQASHQPTRYVDERVIITPTSARHRSPLARFFKAFGVALVVLMLWAALVDSISVNFGIGGSKLPSAKSPPDHWSTYYMVWWTYTVYDAPLTSFCDISDC